jgi:hypothetical protein
MPRPSSNLDLAGRATLLRCPSLMQTKALRHSSCRSDRHPAPVRLSSSLKEDTHQQQTLNPDQRSIVVEDWTEDLQSPLPENLPHCLALTWCHVSGELTA